MNHSLLPPQTQFPEHVEQFPSIEFAVCFEFSHHGEYIAYGLHDGSCYVADFETKSICRDLIAHVSPVTSVSWSHDGRKLLTASLDWRVVLWDLELPKKETVIEFSSIVFFAQIHPKNSSKMIASASVDGLVLVNMKDNLRRTLIFPSDNEDEQTRQTKMDVCSASFTKSGDHILAGNLRSVVCIFSETGDLIHHFKPCNHPIRSITFNNDSRLVLINSGDGVIRLYKTKNLIEKNSSSPDALFQDTVTRLQWKTCCFSHDSEYVLAGSSISKDQNLHVWTVSGRVCGVKHHNHEIFDLKWHPHRYLFVTCSNSGHLYIWSRVYEDNWSAFVPGFKKLDQNEEYLEREDEFDKETVEEIEGRKKTKNDDEDNDVDVVTIERIAAFESNEETFYLPVHIAPEQFEQGATSYPPNAIGIPPSPHQMTYNSGNGFSRDSAQNSGKHKAKQADKGKSKRDKSSRTKSKKESINLAIYHSN